MLYNFANQQENQHTIRENYESVMIMVVPAYLKQTVNNNTQPTQRYLINQHKAQSRPSYCVSWKQPGVILVKLRWHYDFLFKSKQIYTISIKTLLLQSLKN